MRGLAAAGLLAALACAWPAAGYNAAARRVAVVELRSQVSQGSCVDANAQSGQVVLWSCHGGPNQKLDYYDDGTLRHGARCLGAAGASVVLKPCATSDDVRWSFQRGEVRNASGQCLDVAGGQKANGTPLVAWSCQGGPQQQWHRR